MNTRLILVRHAEAEGNFTRVFHGWTDGEITPKGHRQAQQVAERLAGMEVDVLYSSSLRRTLQTAAYISKVKDLPIIRTDKLKEINGGDWEGQSWEQLSEKWPEAYETWEHKPHLHRMPNGETMVVFQKRLIEEIQSILNSHKGKNICIVTHGTAIKALLCHFYTCSLEEMLNIRWCDNTAVTIVDFEEGQFKVVLEGDASHLTHESSTLQQQDWWVEENKRFQQEGRDRKDEQ